MGVLFFVLKSFVHLLKILKQIDMTKKQLVQFLKDNFTSESGYVDLTDLDFGDDSVDIGRLKTKGNLYQDYQKVGLMLYQNHQEVGSSIHQDLQTAGIAIYQDYQKVKINLYQDNQTVGNVIYQNKQDAKEIIN